MLTKEKGLETNSLTQENDPVLSMLGVGKQLWESEPGDSFVERLRSETPVAPPTGGWLEPATGKLAEEVWDRIKSHQGKVFYTVSGLPFTYQVEGLGIWFYREGRRVNRKLTRTQVDIAVSRCPLATTTEIKDLMDYAYLFALLKDTRIRMESW